MYAHDDLPLYSVADLPPSRSPDVGSGVDQVSTLSAQHVDPGCLMLSRKPFDDQSQDYRCPQCQAPKKRFAPYDAETGKVIETGLH